jgi:hypothetical protein
LKEEVINTKLRHKDKLGEAIISIIFWFFYWGFIQDSSLKYVHNIKIKQCLFNILNELENWVKTNDYVEEKIISYRHKIYRWYKWLSHKQYFELFEKNFKERDNYKGLYYWYWEFLD